MMAAMLVVSPIFEADLPDEQHGYRPERGALTAVREVHSLLSAGHKEVVDADLADYFGQIPHAVSATAAMEPMRDRRNGASRRSP